MIDSKRENATCKAGADGMMQTVTCWNVVHMRCARGVREASKQTYAGKNSGKTKNMEFGGSRRCNGKQATAGDSAHVVIEAVGETLIACGMGGVCPPNDALVQVR